MSLILSRRRFGQLAAGTAASLAMPSLASGRQGKDIVIAVQQNPATTEPLSELGNNGFRALYSVFDYLISADFQARNTRVPSLATEWARIDDRTLELKLRTGVKFHNGDVMTAEDVAFSFGPERINSPEAPGYGISRYIWGNLDRVDIVDSNTVRIVSKASDPIMEQRLASWCSQIVSQRAYRDAGSWEAWQQKAIGTGVMKVAENRPGEYLRLEPFDDYWGGKPNVGSVTFRVVPEVAARVAGLATGEFDLISDLPPDQFGDVEGRSGLSVLGGPILGHRVVSFDTRNPQLANPKMRNALSLLVDREAITESLWGGRVGVPRGLQWDEYGDMYIPDYPKPAYNPEAARTLLREAGYGGETIKYRVVNDYYLNEVATAEILVEMWKAEGVNVDLEICENFPLMRAPEGAGMHDWSNGPLFPDPVSTTWRLYGDTAWPQTTGCWKNDEFNQLGGVLNTSMDPAERYAANKRMLDIFTEVDPPAFVLHEFGAFYGKRDGIRMEFYKNLNLDLRAQVFDVA